MGLVERDFERAAKLLESLGFESHFEGDISRYECILLLDGINFRSSVQIYKKYFQIQFPCSKKKKLIENSKFNGAFFQRTIENLIIEFNVDSHDHHFSELDSKFPDYDLCGLRLKE